MSAFVSCVASRCALSNDVSYRSSPSVQYHVADSTRESVFFTLRATARVNPCSSHCERRASFSLAERVPQPREEKDEQRKATGARVSHRRCASALDVSANTVHTTDEPARTRMKSVYESRSRSLREWPTHLAAVTSLRLTPSESC